MSQPPLVEMIGIEKHFGGVRAVDHVSLDLFPGEVVGVLGHNGAGKSCLMRILAGAMIPNAGEIRVNGSPVSFADPNDAREAGIETIYQTLALADHLDAPSNLFLGRELKTRLGNLDDARMLAESRKVLARLNPNFKNLQDPVSSLSGGQRQVIAIARAIYFDTRVLIMDEPTAALGPSETAMVANLIRQLQSEGIGILLVSHDMHDVFDLCDRVVVMNKGRLVGAHRIDEVTKDDVLSLIVKGELPADWTARNLEAAQ
ncbi:MAG: ATP-binding cassette domain-containing protein [Marinovum algicola]|uniref:Monosaccharide ABC transporter ATP-binding protein, CUT2 family n=1 Tax=Marinovum algicola TaxID=42444 RepID=A0A975ZNQ7_9RHOB|nr:MULTISPECIES: ATP-binding cassette domain-containing protein [Marinovum]MDD9741607.1 ATP-binding cassette domain-containing protein [Marinovum sp. SP66]SEJ62675.1 monosaccharide ABC transporter ATP-binding protein, CUT2 family [Marinovum algicola]SLN52482.1 Ribose import ATP-binding protein RbsA [Marinovum algicola]